MKSDGQNLRDLLKTIVKSDDEIFLKTCKVSKISDDEKTIDAVPIDGTPEIKNVRLIGNKDSDGFLIVPKKDSFVQIGFISNVSAVVVMFSDIEKIKVKISDGLEFDTKSGSFKTSENLEIDAGQKIGFKAGGTNFKDLLKELIDEIKGLSMQTAQGIPVIIKPDSIVKLTLLNNKFGNFFK